MLRRDTCRRGVPKNLDIYLSSPLCHVRYIRKNVLATDRPLAIPFILLKKGASFPRLHPPPNVKLHSLAPLLPFHLWLPLTALSGTAMAVRIVVVPPSCAGTLLAADNQWQSEWLRSAVTVRWTADQAVNQHQRTPNGPTKGVKCSGGPKKPPGIFPRSTKVVCWC